MAPSLHVHDLGVRVVELTLTQLAMEADDGPDLIPHLLNILMTHRLHILVSTKVTIVLPYNVCNILFMAPTIKMMVILNLLWSREFVEMTSDVSICFYRSWSRIGRLANIEKSKTFAGPQWKGDWGFTIGNFQKSYSGALFVNKITLYFLIC